MLFRSNTTAELLAGWIAGELRPELTRRAPNLTALRVEVEENFGQWAIFETRMKEEG